MASVSPNKPRTPSRNVRVPDDLWYPAIDLAKQRGETVADVIRRALREYLRDDEQEAE